MHTLVLPTVPKPNPPRVLLSAAWPAAKAHATDNDEACAAKAAFTPFGGTIHADALASLISATGMNGLGVVAKLIVRRRVVSVPIAGNYWLPAFQFNKSTWTLRTAVSRVLRELTPVMADVEIAHWFASPNDWLERACPAEALLAQSLEVVQAARVQRFVCSI
jgi:hypothetical protein